MAFAAALTITLAALRGSDADVVVIVDDGIETVTESLSTTYQVKVHNNTDQQLDQLEVTLTTPSSLVLGPTDSGQRREPVQTKWRVDVAAGATAQVELDAAVGEISAGGEITVIACAAAVDLTVACGADVNRGMTALKAESDVSWLTTLTTWWQFLLAAPGVLPVVLLIVFAACRPFRRGDEARDRHESS
ncbi:hypothetical protein ABZ345_44255 [Lentzea sp. NPDC005914]|uniref:hypothetical protein n=1 Tax=Lentzea sp. NPDC005914 TaxID=3154572 RepID=UPI00340894AE